MSAAIVAMNATDARALNDRIKAGVEAIWELIKKAYVERAWAALGYESWDDYCTSEFGTSRLRLPREERAEVVASLRESGLSQRAIASATGLDRKTVRRDLDQQVGEKGPPAPLDPVSGDDLLREMAAALARRYMASAAPVHLTSDLLIAALNRCRVQELEDELGERRAFSSTSESARCRRRRRRSPSSREGR